MYFLDSPFWKTFINVGMTVLFTILTPTLVLRSRFILMQAVGVLLPIATYYVAFVFALYSLRGFHVRKSISIASPVITLFDTIAVAIVLYAWISSQDFTAGEALTFGPHLDSK